MAREIIMNTLVDVDASLCEDWKPNGLCTSLHSLDKTQACMHTKFYGKDGAVFGEQKLSR